MSSRRSKILASGFSFWAFLSLVSLISGVSLPGLLNYVDEIEYGCSGPEVVDGIWMRPCMYSSSHGFTLPLLYSHTTTGPPFSIGVTVLDYENENECLDVVVDELFVIIDGKRRSMLQQGETISAPFKRYVTGSSNVKADCYVDLADMVSADNEWPIVLEAKLRVRTDDRDIEQSVYGVLPRGGWQGYWFIWEALFPHA